MKRYRIGLLVLVFVAFAGFIVLRRSQVSAQTLNVKVTPTNVSRVVLAKVNPGQRPAFDQDVMNNLIPVFEEEKKAGIITGYEFFNNVTADNPIELKHYGSAAKRQAAGERRNQIRTVISNRLIRMVNYSQATPVS
jgi:hypothetical protein